MTFTNTFKFELHNISNDIKPLLLITFEKDGKDYVFAEYISSNEDVAKAAYKLFKENSDILFTKGC